MEEAQQLLHELENASKIMLVSYSLNLFYVLYYIYLFLIIYFKLIYISIQYC